MGSQHITQFEDQPGSSTVGRHLSFFLLPYNYFPECPSSISQDSVRVESQQANLDLLRVDRNGNKADGKCGKLTLEELVQEKSSEFLQTDSEHMLP